MSVLGVFWPQREERQLLGRFYLAEGVGELFFVIWPFQFAYLFMVMERPEWAVTPLLLESLVTLLAEIPTGAFADRYGRRRAVILGDTITACGFALVPLAAQADGTGQLTAVSACFGVAGFGQALVSGAGEAWVVDNLAVAGRRDLVESYFARVNSFMALGAVGSGALALLMLLGMQVSRPLLDGLWYLSALGVLFAVVIETTIAEHRPEPGPADTARPAPGLAAIMLVGLRVLRGSRSLLLFATAMVIAAFPESVADDAFDMSLITKGMDARALAPLGILDNIIGIGAPLIGMALWRHFGATRVLAVLLLLPALAVSVLFVSPLLVTVIVLYILLDFVDGVWDPVADAHLQTMIESQTRATVVSIVSHAIGAIELLGIGLFALLLGEHSEQLDDIVPDLITAFSGGAPPATAAPLTDIGLQVPDLAIVVFMFVALLALPFLLLSAKAAKTVGQRQ
jgi:MFS family permease